MKAEHKSMIIPKKIRDLLAEGYREMASEALEITKEFEYLDNEAAQYAD